MNVKQGKTSAKLSQPNAPKLGNRRFHVIMT